MKILDAGEEGLSEIEETAGEEQEEPVKEEPAGEEQEEPVEGEPAGEEQEESGQTKSPDESAKEPEELSESEEQAEEDEAIGTEEEQIAEGETIKTAKESGETWEETEPGPELEQDSEQGIEESEIETEPEPESEPEIFPVTGEVARETGGKEEKSKAEYVDGSCSTNNPFFYELEEGKTAGIKKNSVETEEVDEKGEVKKKKIADNLVTLRISGNQAEVSTDYSIVERGFGEKYLTDKINYLDIDLDNLKIKAEQGTLIVSLVYNDAVLAEDSKEILVAGEIPEENIAEIENITEINITEANITITNKTAVDETALNVTTKQYKAVINRPVKWIKFLKVNDTTLENLTLKLPKKARNITIKKDKEVQEALDEIEEYGEIVDKADKQSLITGQITGDVSLEIRENKGILTRFWKWVTGFVITGRVVQEEEIKDEIIETQDSRIVDLKDILPAEEQIGVEYYTDAPTAEEINISRGKKVIVSGPDELNYTEILAYSVLDNRISMNNTEKIKIYLVREEVKEAGVIEKEPEKVIEQTQNQTQEQNITEQPAEPIETPAENITEEPAEPIETPAENITEQPAENITEEINITIPENIIEINETENIEINETAETYKSLIIGQVTAEQTEEPVVNEQEILEPEQNLTEKSKQKASKIIRTEVNFTAYDLDEDGGVDYIEWEVPHLSQQVYEIIYITKAEHLDENKSFIEDVYDYVREKDNNWTTIPAEHYIRVTFEKPLTKEKDITIYAQRKGTPLNASTSSEIEVYTENNNTLITTFTNISEAGWYKVYLTDLAENETQDTFDLRISCGSSLTDNILEENQSANNSLNSSNLEFNINNCLGVEFDYIVDPEIEPAVETGLVGLWHLNNDSAYGENDTHVYDFSGNGNNGTWYGDATPDADSGPTASGKVGAGAFMFDGAGDYVSIGIDDSLDLTENFTILAWIKPTDVSGLESIIIRGKDANIDTQYYMGLSNNDLIIIVANDSDSQNPYGAENVIVGNVWQQVGFRINDSDITGFYNGMEKDSTTRTIFNLGGGVVDVVGLIGEMRTVGSRPFNGSIDEVAIYNRSLNASEIQRLYEIGLPVTANLTNIWNCSTTQLFTNTSCWSIGRVPVAYDDVIFNGSGTGNVNITNNTMPQYLNSFTVEGSYTGTITFHPLFAKGDWTGNNDGTQLWNVTNNINISNGTMKIYGDYLHVNFTGVGGNITDDGHGQEWRSTSGNISVGGGATLDGVGLGFPIAIGPGYNGARGGSHGGKGGNEGAADPYGNASAPTSLGSGGDTDEGGSAIKLHATDLIQVEGTINMNGDNYNVAGAGGSIWLKADNISGNGTIKAEGGHYSATIWVGGGGRIRLEYGSSMSLTGTISLAAGYEGSYGANDGTLTFTNNTWPGNWNLTGDVGLLGGDYGDGETVNVQGYFDTNGWNMTIYGDCFYSVTNPSTCWNTTDDGKGVWLNVSGNITISSASYLDGMRLGFPGQSGPGYESNDGGTYGGKGGGNSKPTYGSETQPTSLGSGGGSSVRSAGGSAIKLESLDRVQVDGRIDMRGHHYTHTGSGGSIWLNADNITGSGTLDASSRLYTTSWSTGGGGRIALTGGSIVDFSGVINNLAADTDNADGSGGTVYINATNSITSSGNITTTGLDGGNITFADTYLVLSGVYNASNLTGGTTWETILVNYTDCGSDFTAATFDPAATYQGCGGGPGTNIWNCSTTQKLNNASCWSLGRAPSPGDDVIFNGTATGNANITNNSLVQNLNSFTVEGSYTGTITFHPLFAKGDWTGNNDGTQLWNVTNNINISNGTMKIYGDYLHVDFTGVGGNITDDGHGQEWRSVGGNISVGGGAVLDGYGLGFPADVGPGYVSIQGGTHGGRGGGGSAANPYGNASAPTSLGSGGQNSAGGSGIKLHAVDKIEIDGTISMNGSNTNVYTGAGGSIWLKADNISMSGSLEANGGTASGSIQGGGGRIRLEYGSALESTGKIVIGTGEGVTPGKHGPLTFTNNTWPGNWNLTGNIGLLGGDYGEGNVTNIQGDFNTNDYDITIYGSCFYDATDSNLCYNTTANGEGVWINASGNITISSGSVLDGYELGFPGGAGPGYDGGYSAGTHGGKGETSSASIYGNASAPTSLGSGGHGGAGGSAVKLQTNNGFIKIEGNIDVKGRSTTYSGAGGSIWLKADNISGIGTLNASGGAGTLDGGGGRIALTSSNVVEFSGTINNKGGTSANEGSGGTVYVNATNSITSSGNITTTGKDGGNITFSDTYLVLSGVYNATNGTGGVTWETILVNYTDCGSELTGTFDPAYTKAAGAADCTGAFNVTVIRPYNITSGVVYNTSTVDFNVSTSLYSIACNLSIDGDVNVTMTLNSSNTGANYTNATLSTAVHTADFTCWNSLGENALTSISFSVDTGYPAISFENPTPSDGSFRELDSIYVNVSVSDSNNVSTFIDFDNSLVSWWRFDDVNASGDPTDYMHCYDNETQILTLNEVDCSEVDVNDEDIIIEYYDDNGNLINTNNIYNLRLGGEMSKDDLELNRGLDVYSNQISSINREQTSSDNEQEIDNSYDLGISNSDNKLNNNMINNINNFIQDGSERENLDVDRSLYVYDSVINSNDREIEIVSGLEEGLIGFIMMSEENENNSFVLFIDNEFENKTFHDMNASLSSQAILQRLIMKGVFDNFSYFIVNNLSQDRIFFAGFVNLSFTGGSESEFITHFDESNSLKNSSAELYTLPVSSFNLLFNSSICSFLGCSSSTGCQSICSQNSQSSSVTSLVSLYLADMSCFINLTTALTNNLGSNLNSLDLSSCILTNNIEKSNYLNLSEGDKLNNKENKKGSNRMAKFCKLLTHDYDICNNKYINVSVDNDNAGVAPVASMVMQRSEKLGLVQRLPGSIPILGASTLSTSKKCYKEEWKYFYELEEDEKVMTLNAETGEKEWQLPMEYQEFNYDDEMYKVVLEDGSNLLVSEKHKVYVGENYQILPAKKSFTKSDVVSTGTNDCSLRCGSLDQIAELFNNASARYGESLGSDKFLIAFVNNSLYADSLKNSIDSNISFCLISNSCIESFDLDKHNLLYLPSSSFTNSGAINSALIEENKYEDIDNGFISENNMLLSNTSIILVYLYSSLFSGDIESSNSALLFLDNFESNFLNESSFALLPNSTDHLINSCSSEELNLFSNSCLFNSSCLTNSDQTTQTNLDNLVFNSSSIANVTDAIYSFPSAFNFSTFSSSSTFLITTLRATSATFTSGNCFLNLDNNSSGICTVILDDLTILTPCSIYFNESNYANVYKSFGEKDLNLSNFKLQPVTETYELINNGKELYFLDSENNPVRVKSIEKQDYDNNGEMYKIILGDGDGKESELLVSEGHKVYVKESDFLKSSVLNILIEDCSLNLGSLDQIAQLSFNASAKIGTSLSCINCFACDSNCSNDSLGIILMNLFNSSNISLNCTELILEYFNTSDSFFFNSSITYSGADISNPIKSELIIINLTGLSLKKDMNMLVSTTNSIYQPSFLYLFQTPSLILSPIFRQSSSVSSEFSNILSSFLSNKALLTFSSKNCLIDSEKFNSGNLSNFSLSSLDTDNVMFGILVPPVYPVKDVQVFKSFGSEDNSKDVLKDLSKPSVLTESSKSADLSDFKLQEISDVYNNLNNINNEDKDNEIINDESKGKELYFLDEDNNPVKIKSIEKESYNGKIYDVDVENDIVLVKRHDGKAFWSGNSNNGTAEGDATQTDAGKLGKGFEFDGNGDYVSVDDNSLDINNNLTISAWIKLNNLNTDYFIVTKQPSGTAQNNYPGNYEFRVVATSGALQLLHQIGLSVSLSTYSSTSNIISGGWYYVAVTLVEGGNVIFYINGSSAGSSSQSGAFGINDEPVRIGTRKDFYSYFNGTIDDVMIFNRSLSASEIQALYANTSSRYLEVNFTGLTDGSHTFKAYTQDLGGNVNNTEMRTVTIDTGLPAINILYPANGTNHSFNTVEVNYSYSEINVVACWWTNDSGANNYSLTCGSNVTGQTWPDGNNTIVVYINDSANNENSSAVTFVVDTNGPSVSIVYPDNAGVHYSATIEFNVSAGDVLFAVDSCLYSLDDAANVSMGKFNATYFNSTYSGIAHGYHNLTVSCNDTLNNWNSTIETNWQVNLLDLTIANVTVPDAVYTNSTFIVINISNAGPPNAINVNVSCFVNNTLLGSNLVSQIDGANSYITNCTVIPKVGDNQELNVTVDPENTIAELNESNNNYAILYVNVTQVANISISIVSEANTTDTMNVQGLIIGNDGVVQASKMFTIKLNNVTVSSDTFNYTNFSAGSGDGVNISGFVKLNLTSQGDEISYTDDYSTTKYTSDAYSYNNLGYYAPDGTIFEADGMTEAIGNITYRFTAMTQFYNASAYVVTDSSPSDPGGNTSVWYSLDNATWNLLGANTSSGARIGGLIPAGLYSEFYVMVMSNITSTGSPQENPVASIEINYTNYNYSSEGNFVSGNITLTNVTYTVLKWGRVLNGGTVKVQLRESDDGVAWGSWSSNYTNNADSDISSFSKYYLQFRTWLSSSNLSRTPVLNSVQILYFNASTNSSGGYNYNITIPTDNLGPLPLEVAISAGESRLTGKNETNITIWARTSLPYVAVKNYTVYSSNYTIYANFTRSDTDILINGSINITIYNSTGLWSQFCNKGNNCSVSWLIPDELSYGNYTVNISGSNESAYYRNGSTSFAEYLEEKNTTGTLLVVNKTLGDFTVGTDYIFYWNASVSNTGKASMTSIYVYDYTAARSSGVKSISQITPCSRLYPGNSCNATMMITMDGSANVGVDNSHFISWRANWSDNDGGVAGGNDYISYAQMYVIILGNASLDISNYSINMTMQHESSRVFTFDAEAVGSTDVSTVNVSFLAGNISAGENLSLSWVNATPNLISLITAGGSSEVTVNISVPAYVSPGNYSGAINVSSSNGGEKLLKLRVEVPENYSWYVVPGTNLSYNRSFSLDTAGEVGNFTLVNLGNVNLTMNVSYTPARTTDYTAFGTALFEVNQVVSGLVRNPTQANITAGENTTIALYQKGRSSSLNDVGVNILFKNTTASPATIALQEAFWIEERDPNITNIWFYVDGIAGSAAEINKNVTIKVRATDDINLNQTATKINITWSGGSVLLNATNWSSVTGEYEKNGVNFITLNYTANFTPSSAVLHNVTASVYDVNGRTFTSSVYNFTAYATTTLGLNVNVSSISVENVDLSNKETFYVNFSVNNTGSVYAYEPNLTFVKNASIALSPLNYTYSDLQSGGNASLRFQINVSEAVIVGQYNITATVRWRNPDNTYSTNSVILSLNVLSNKSIAYNPGILNLTVPSGSSNSTVLTLNNTGNDLLDGMNLSCITGSLCGNFTISFNETNFNISVNSSRNINVTLTAAQGLEGGAYNGTVNISEKNISSTVGIYAYVPETLTWTAAPQSINSTKAVSQSGALEEVIITNTGNVDITFVLNSTNSTIIQPNISSIGVSKGTNSNFMVNYSSPANEGSYFVEVTITNSSANPPQLNVSVNLTATQINLTLFSPTTASPLANVTTGQNITVAVNATYSGAALTSNSSWTVGINSSSCTNVNSTYYASTTYWNVSCTAPSIADGRTYNLTLTLTHDTYGQIVRTEASAVTYRDVSPPSFDISRNHINISQNISLSVNVTDNVNVSSVWFELRYPNSSTYGGINATMSLSNNLYVFTDLALDLAGEYTVNYSANDTTGNENLTTDWFEVYNKYYWVTKLLDYNSQAISNVNVSLTRPDTTTILLNNVTDSRGEAGFDVNKRAYDVHAVVSGDEIIVRGVNFTNVTSSGIVFNIHRIASGDLVETVALHEAFQGIASNSTNLSYAVSAVFNYTGLGYDNSNELEVVKCANWNYAQRACDGSWSVITSSIDKDTTKVTGNSTSFSAYFLAEDRCGNGLCEVSYGETTSTCLDDCRAATSTTTITGGGGGGGGLSTGDLERIEEIVKSFLDIGGVKVETTSIYKELFAGDTTTVRVTLKNTLNSPTTISLSAEGDVKQFIFFDKPGVELGKQEQRDVLIKIVAPKMIKSGNYDGDLILKSGEKEGKVPVTIRILAPEGKLLDVKIQPLTPVVAPGGILRLQTDLLNLGKTKKVDVQFDLQLLDVETGEIITRIEEAFAVETTTSVVKELKIPEYTIPGKYMVKAVVYYSSLEDKDMQASSIAYVKVQHSFFKRQLFGIPLWIYLLVLLVAVGAVGGFFYAKWLVFKKKRFKIKVDMAKLPQATAHSAFVGKVAETGIRTFVDLNKLPMHTLVAGATGSGKTIAAQDIIEGALLHKKSVIVFDPTAQWTGFLRKCIDKGMLKRYKYFDMKTGDAKSFNGVIKTVHDPYELINLKEYMNKPGEITVFNISHLTPKEIDVVAASTIEQVFKSEPEESKELKTLIVYDEVHRLLPKFGGSGQGFIQLERGAREFRKWGIGLVLISQVLSDFVGEIKANIGTEIQMGTRYEGDLERVNMKYGEDILKSVVKEPIGTGMAVNAEYNNGKPYFVSFRPILHSTRRLTNEELKKYEKYFEEIEDLEYQTVQLEKLKVDVLDLELEIKLAKGKIKEGAFQMADMYLESLRPRIEDNWKKIGKKPMHRVKEKIRKEEVLAGIAKAKKEREKYIKKTPEEKVSFDQEISALKKQLEEKKKKGKKTTDIEMKLTDLENRLKPFKGKVSKKDAEDIEKEVSVFKKEVGGL